ncbi:MAG: hypothetical protein JXB00_16170 [Bacteroidales bacterium]|nr:hypothetical protein [Bacteroidales bacterium]
MKGLYLLLLLQLFMEPLKSNIFYPADNDFFQYTGRIDFSNPREPVFWVPGAYIRAR